MRSSCPDTKIAFPLVPHAAKRIETETLPSEEPLNSQVKEYCHEPGNWVRASYEWYFEGKKYFGDRGLEIMEKRWMSLLPKREDKLEVGPVFVDRSLK